MVQIVLHHSHRNKTVLVLVLKKHALGPYFHAGFANTPDLAYFTPKLIR